MFYIPNILNIVINSDTLVWILLLLLILSIIAIIFLSYKQNKDSYEEIEKTNELNTIHLIAEEINRKEEKVVEDTVIENDIVENKQANEKDIDDLQSLTKELETLPKERTIKLTPYEEEQEKKAIISYDELVKQSKNVSINYSNENLVTDSNISIKKVDLDKTGKIEMDPIKRELNSRVTLNNYAHEEEFLEALKQLNKLLN